MRHAWEEYLAAAQGLDAVRRQATAAAVQQRAALRAAQQELAAASRRLALQRERLTELAGRYVVRLAPLEPGDGEVGAARVTGGPDALLTALQQARSAMDAADAADAALAAADIATPRPPLTRLARLTRLAPLARSAPLAWLARFTPLGGGTPAPRTLAVYAVFALVVLALSTCAGFGVSALLG